MFGRNTPKIPPPMPPKAKFVYKIVHYGDIAGLQEEVQKLCDQGWKPLGGIAIDSEDWSYQALIKTIYTYPANK